MRGTEFRSLLAWPNLVALASVLVLLWLTLLYLCSWGCSLIVNLPGPFPPSPSSLPLLLPPPTPLFFSRANWDWKSHPIILFWPANWLPSSLVTNPRWWKTIFTHLRDRRCFNSMTMTMFRLQLDFWPQQSASEYTGHKTIQELRTKPVFPVLEESTQKDL